MTKKNNQASLEYKIAVNPIILITKVKLKRKEDEISGS